MSHPGGPGASSSWKKRLTPKQLERKRQSDRMSQRRTRQQAKHTMAELEERLRLLASGDQYTLINRLLAENEMLRNKINHYQSKMELMYLCTKECLDESDNEVSNAVSWTGSTATSVPQQKDQDDRIVTALDDTGLHADARNKRQRNPSIATVVAVQRPSMIFEAAVLARGSQTPESAELDVNELLQSMITWKVAHSSRVKFGFLIEQFELDKAPISLTVERVEQFVLLNNLYERVLVSIVQGTETPEVSLRSDDQHRVHDPTVVEYERRAALVCACATVWHWRSYFKSTVEFISMFWTQYQYFMFLTFPTVENLNKLPAWLKPTKSQTCHGHPGFVDFLVWPHLREHLVSSWYQYDLDKLVLQLIENFEVDYGSMTLDSPLLSLDSNGWELQLSEDFDHVLKDIRNFRTKADFALSFPELMPCVRSSACGTCHLPVLNPSSSDLSTRKHNANQVSRQVGSEGNSLLPNNDRDLTELDYLDMYNSSMSDVTRPLRDWQQTANSTTGSQDPGICNLLQSSHNDVINATSSNEYRNPSDKPSDKQPDSNMGNAFDDSWFYDQMDVIFGVNVPSCTGILEDQRDFIR